MQKETFEHIVDTLEMMRDNLYDMINDLSPETIQQKHLTSKAELPWKPIYKDVEDIDEALTQLLKTVNDNYLGTYYECFMQKPFTKQLKGENPIIAEINAMATLVNEIMVKRETDLPLSALLPQDAGASDMEDAIDGLLIRMLRKIF